MIVIVTGDAKSHAARGAAAVLFGIVALVWPGLTLLALVLLFGAYALVDGASTLITAFNAERSVRRERGPLQLHGLVAIFAGVVTFVWPDITALALVYVIAAWALLTGVFQLVDAYRMRDEISNEWLLAIMGGLRVVFGLILAIAPGSGALAITWLIGWYAILDGALHLGLAWKLRRLEHSLDSMRRPMRSAPA
jgi:uncharacterized membrane protein HdeD (DUF308 family)